MACGLGIGWGVRQRGKRKKMLFGGANVYILIISRTFARGRYSLRVFSVCVASM